MVAPGHPAFPHAMVLTAYFALSPVTGLSCHRRPQETCKKLASRKLDASVGASGPHDFAVRRLAPSSTRRLRPSHPVPNVRDDRDTPLVRDGITMDLEVIWVESEPEYFSVQGWTLICCFARRAQSADLWDGFCAPSQLSALSPSFDGIGRRRTGRNLDQITVAKFNHVVVYLVNFALKANRRAVCKMENLFFLLFQKIDHDDFPLDVDHGY